MCKHCCGGVQAWSATSVQWAPGVLDYTGMQVHLQDGLLRHTPTIADPAEVWLACSRIGLMEVLANIRFCDDAKDLYQQAGLFDRPNILIDAATYSFTDVLTSFDKEAPDLHIPSFTNTVHTAAPLLPL